MAQTSFVYCPYCGSVLQGEHRFGALRPACPSCSFVHFRDPKVAVVALVTARGDEGDQVLLVRRGVEPMKGRWSLPGGYMDAGEMPQAALARELREEVGLEAEVAPLPLEIYLLEHHGTAMGIVLAFQAVPAANAPAPTPGDDVTEACWFPAAHLPADLAFDSTRHLLDAWAQGRTPVPAGPASTPRSIP
jgi:ADP-ribose pyrophosphatase YjhB (NUDIX family)